MTHIQLLNEATRAILAVYAEIGPSGQGNQFTTGSAQTRRSLIELENLIHELIVHIEVFP